MKKNILLLLLILPCTLCAQDSLGHFLFGISWNNIVNDRFSTLDGENQELKENLDSLETKQYGLSTGIQFGYCISEHAAIGSGILYSDKGYNIDELSVSNIRNIKYHYRYLELPLRYQYSFPSTKKIQPLVSVGCSLGYLINQKTIYQRKGFSSKDSFENKDQLSPLSIGLLASIGIQMKVQNDYILQIDGNYNQSLLSLSNSPFKRYLNGLGIQLSLLRKF